MIDTGNGQVSLGTELGQGSAVGLYGGGAGQIGIDWTNRLTPQVREVEGEASGFVTTGPGLEIAHDDDGLWPPGGVSGSFGPGGFGGVYHEKRIGTIRPLFNFYELMDDATDFLRRLCGPIRFRGNHGTVN